MGPWHPLGTSCKCHEMSSKKLGVKGGDNMDTIHTLPETLKGVFTPSEVGLGWVPPVTR